MEILPDSGLFFNDFHKAGSLSGALQKQDISPKDSFRTVGSMSVLLLSLLPWQDLTFAWCIWYIFFHFE